MAADNRHLRDTLRLHPGGRAVEEGFPRRFPECRLVHSKVINPLVIHKNIARELVFGVHRGQGKRIDPGKLCFQKLGMVFYRVGMDTPENGLVVGVLKSASLRDLRDSREIIDPKGAECESRFRRCQRKLGSVPLRGNRKTSVGELDFLG